MKFTPAQKLVTVIWLALLTWLVFAILGYAILGPVVDLIDLLIDGLGWLVHVVA